jgi:peptidoglycan hydrolase-like protein with peptidoglycan-binding domain
MYAPHPAATTTTTTITPVTTFKPGTVAHTPITKPLSKGSSGTWVIILQTLLATNATIFPEQAVTGYYGPATARAVGRFQIKYGIAKQGDTGYGSVGPKTRAVLNTLETL